MRGFILSLVFHLLVAVLFWVSTVRTERVLFPETVYEVVLLPDLPAEVAAPEPERVAEERPLPVPDPPPTPPPRRRPPPEREVPQEPVPEEPPRKPEPTLAERLRERLLAEVPTSEREPRRVPEPERPPAEAPRVERPSTPPVTERPEAGEPPDTEQVAVDVASDFREDWYLNLLVRRLQEGWRLMRAKEGISLVQREVYVSFKIDRQGRIHDISTARPSGNLVFDRSAISAVEFSSPLPPLPQSWRRDALQVRVRFREE